MMTRSGCCWSSQASVPETTFGSWAPKWMSERWAIRAGMAPPTSRGGSGSAPFAAEARAEAGEELILREAGLGGGGGQVVVELNPVPFAKARCGVDADGGEVRRDAAEDGEEGLVHLGPACAGEAAEIAVRIADVEDGELGGFGRGEGGVVADGRAGRDRLALDHLRLDPHHLADMPRRLAPRDAAVEGEAGPGEVERIVAAEADAGAVGEAEAAGAYARGKR